MTLIAPTLQAFFTDRLVQQRNASPHTVVAYRRSFCLLLEYVQQSTGKQPSQLDFANLNAAVVVAFLRHLEDERGNTIRSRNARLAAIHSFFRFAAYAELGISRKAEQRMHGGESGVAAGDAEAPIVLEVVEEGPDHWRIEVVQASGRDTDSGSRIALFRSGCLGVMWPRKPL